MSTDPINAAAIALADAQAVADREDAALAVANDARDVLADRMAALQSERSEIVANARAGSTDPELALRMAAIDLDIIDLGELIRVSDAEVTVAQSTAIDARQRVVFAESQLQTATDDEFESRVLAHANHLDSLLLQAMNEITALAARHGSKPIWAPSIGLADAVHKAHLNRGTVR